MRKLILSTIVLVSVFSSCLKNSNSPVASCTPVTTAAPATEVTALKTYLDTNNIAVKQDSRGFFYSIDSSGVTPTSTYPTICSAVSVTYTGTFLNGTAFDSTGANTPASFNLSGLIVGWQEAIPLMKLNQVMTLYLPPSLAYGASGSGPIPGNTNLKFTIKLFAFN